MQHRYQRYGTGSFVINIDSYHDGVMAGQLYYPHYNEVEQFHSFVQLVCKIEHKLKEPDAPQAYNVIRTFFPPYLLDKYEDEAYFPRAGKLATFSLHIMFRQNASWQGRIHWLEEKQEQNFRSVLELMSLMDNALIVKQLTAYHPEADKQPLEMIK